MFGKIVGIGRGSASSSLISYSMGLTFVDPVKNGLVFDRFLSETRLKLGFIPDFDLDTNARDVLIPYLKYKYGKDNFAHFPINNNIPMIKSIRDVLLYKSKNSHEKISEIIKDIEQYLKQNKIDKLVIVGMQTEYCVNATSTRAVELGYDVTLVKDAHSTWDSDENSAVEIIELHHDKWKKKMTLINEKDVDF